LGKARGVRDNFREDLERSRVRDCSQKHSSGKGGAHRRVLCHTACMAAHTASRQACS
jgi:hypothetical protein